VQRDAACEERLSYNYRNPQPVSRIANKLLEMRSQRLDFDVMESARSNQAFTPMPIRICTNRSESNDIIRQLALQIGSLGVIQQDKQRLDIENIEFQRSFTPQTAKGLEFDVVCLVGFNGLYRDLAVKGKRKLSPRQLFARFNEVYVSTTRTRDSS